MDCTLRYKIILYECQFLCGAVVVISISRIVMILTHSLHCHLNLLEA
jgi:hypothetical protein